MLQVAPVAMQSSASSADTPQLQAEQLQRSQHSIAGELASFSTVFQPEQIAWEVWGGVERGDFHIIHGLDGFMLGTLTAGMSPAAHTWRVVVQVCSGKAN